MSLNPITYFLRKQVDFHDMIVMGIFLESQLLHYAGMMDILGHEENIISLKDRSFVGHIF